jgi:myo-inositol-1-phosphate synthase
VDANKVGKDLRDAIFEPINNTIKIADVPKLGVKVSRGPTLDGLGQYYRQTIQESKEAPVDVAQVLKDTKTDILVNYLPVGSEEATKFYMNEAIKAKVGVVNCMPVFIASNPVWKKKFRDAGLPIIGDDIKAQLGATITHRVLTKLFSDRGVILDRTYQLNFGGNMDFMNMLERSRLESKKISKTGSVVSQLSHPIAPENIHIGPSDYIPWLKDRKWCHIRMEGREFGDIPINIDMKLEVWDSPNSAGIVIDAVRCVKLAKDAGVGGELEGPSSYFMKTPPVQYPDSEAKEMVEAFIESNGKAKVPVKV